MRKTGDFDYAAKLANDLDLLMNRSPDMPDTTPQAMTALERDQHYEWLDGNLWLPGRDSFNALKRYIAHLESRLAIEYERGVKDGEAKAS